jgi:hypothetical protein
VIADGFGTPDQGASFLFMVGAFAFGWIGIRRLRHNAFPSLPPWGAWTATTLCAACLVMAVVIPSILRPSPRAGRPSSDARIAIASPATGSVFHGAPADVPIQLRLTGGTIVIRTSTKLVRNEGHVHLYLDGALVSMQYALGAVLRVAPGSHELVAEFVALDHAPFRPRVEATSSFSVAP